MLDPTKHRFDNRFSPSIVRLTRCAGQPLSHRFGWPLRGIIWFYLVIIGSCAVIALLAGYVQKARSFEKVSDRMETVTFGLK
jgi:hypothetical protein